MAIFMAKVFPRIQTVINISVNGKMVIWMDKEPIPIKAGTGMKGNGGMINVPARGPTPIQMVMSM